MLNETIFFKVFIDPGIKVTSGIPLFILKNKLYVSIVNIRVLYGTVYC